jgi:hypothetical protein
MDSHLSTNSKWMHLKLWSSVGLEITGCHCLCRHVVGRAHVPKSQQRRLLLEELDAFSPAQRRRLYIYLLVAGHH